MLSESLYLIVGASHVVIDLSHKRTQPSHFAPACLSVRARSLRARLSLCPRASAGADMFNGLKAASTTRFRLPPCSAPPHHAHSARMSKVGPSFPVRKFQFLLLPLKPFI